MHLVVACSVNSILLLTHAIPFHILVPTKFSLAWSNLDNHAEQWDIALDCLFNDIKQFSSGPGLHLQQLRVCLVPGVKRDGVGWSGFYMCLDIQ